MEAILGREEKGMELLLQHYGPLMRYIIAPILPHPEDREEALNEAALRIWEKAALFDRSRGSWKAWITVVTRSVALNMARTTGGHSSLEDLPAELPNPDPTPEEILLRQERKKQLKGAIDLLSESDQLLFYRKYYYRQSTRQIAGELGLTERAVEGRLHRIRKRLRKLLGGELGG